MKAFLSFVSSKTQSLLGHQIPRHKVHPGGSKVAHAPLTLLAESANAIGPDTDITKWVDSLKSLKLSDRIVAYEGSFGTAVCLDASHPTEQSRVAQMVELAPDHLAGLGLGVGHALASLNITADISQAVSEHYLGWMAMDSYGMNQGYFHWYDSVQNMQVPKNLPPLAMAAFEQGLGRAIWFISNGDPKVIQPLLERFPVTRQPNLWRGVGLMTSFWGAEDEQGMKKLLKLSKQFRPFFQQGAAQGVSFRVDLDDVNDYTEAASRLICSASIDEIGELCELLMVQNTGDTFDSRAYHSWQNALVDFFSEDYTK